MRTPPTAGLAVTVGCLLAAGLTACSSGAGPAPAATAYLAAWSSGDLGAAAARTSDPPAAKAALSQLTHNLDASRVQAVAGKVSEHGSTANVAFTATVALAGLGDWRYTGSLPLHKVKTGWQVVWGPADIHPQLRAGLTLARTRSLPERAAILGLDGQPLFTPTSVVTVGVEPDKLTDPAGELATLAGALHIDAAGAMTRVAQTQPRSAFVTLITLRQADYDRVKAQIHDLPGVLFRTDTAQLAPSATFGRALLGRVGPASAEVLRRAGAAYAASDTLGLGGLQEAFQTRLAGTAHGAVTLVDAAGHPVGTLHSFAGTPGQPVETTVDRGVQQAAEQALGGVAKPAALVAVRPSDGAVLAVANTPAAGSYDRALVGRYPPGSTFKVVTGYALLRHGVTAATPAPCPPTADVGGKTFHNFEGEARSHIPPFATDFVISCNTAFVKLSGELGDTDLAGAARALGIGAAYALPVPAFAGSLPGKARGVERAAEAIGQGQVLVSPLAMAMVAAAVASGTARAPVLVTSPAPVAPSAGAPPAAPLDPAAIGTLRTLMGQVVTDPAGTAAGAGLPAGTHGKTGTAEYGSGSPPSTHAWFTGYRGDLAFAVLVEGGGVGGSVAAPLAAKFLAGLPPAR